MLNIEALNIASLIFSIVILGYSAYSDLKTREVSNWVWMTYLPVSLVILVLRSLVSPQLISISVISIIVMTCLSFLMFCLGLFGGADLKAFIGLSVALPMHPLPLRPLLVSLNPLFPLTVFYNSYLFSLFVVFYVIIRNVEWKYVKRKGLFNDLKKTSPLRMALALLTGYKIDFDSLSEKVYLYPMEEVSKNGGESYRQLKFFLDSEADRDELLKNLGESLSDGEKSEVWVTPGIPLLLFVWLALISSTFAGDILLWVVFQIASLTSIFSFLTCPSRLLWTKSLMRYGS